MSKEIKELVLKIIDKAMEVSAETVADVTVDFNGSAQYLCVRIFGEGYKNTDGKLTYASSTFFDLGTPIENLKLMYSEICKYEKAQKK